MNDVSGSGHGEKKFLGDVDPSFLIFRNSLFVIRPIVYDNMQTLFSWRSDPKINQYLYASPPANMQEQLQWYERYKKDPDSLHFMAFRKRDEDIKIGYCQLFKGDRSEKTIEFGTVIGNSQSVGKGAGVKLTVTFVKIIFSFLGFRAVFANINPQNRGAYRILHDLLEFKTVHGSHKYSKDSEVLFRTDKAAFESCEKKLILRSKEWKEILNIEKIEI